MTKITLFLSAFCVSAGIIPLTIFASRKLHLFDHIDNRKIHNCNISRLGGIAIFAGFMALYLFGVFNGTLHHYCNTAVYTTAITGAFLTGFLDDIMQFRARYKLALQILAASLAVYSGLSIERIEVLSLFTIELGVLSSVFTVIWIVLFVNVINLMDGMDGLAGGVSLIAALFMAAIAFSNGNTAVLMISLIMSGAILGFLVFNFPPAKIFMGDGGAYFLGFLFGTMPLMGVSKTSTFTLFLFPLALLSLHILDIVSVILIRSSNGQHIFVADNNHIHHRLMRLGLSVRTILVVFYGLTCIFGFISLSLLHLPRNFALLFYFGIFCISSLIFLGLYIAEEIRIRNAAVRPIRSMELINMNIQVENEIHGK